MQKSLGSKNNLSFINGSIEFSEPLDLNRATWERCNYLVHSWLLSSVSEPISKTIIFQENSLDVWINIKEIFSKVDGIIILNLRAEINYMKQGSKLILNYYNEMCGLWEELNPHRPMTPCTCNQQCKCEVMHSARNFSIDDQIIQFFIGLDDKFYVIKT